MSNRDLPMMPWYPKDFIAATRHLAFAERALYRELLDYEWELGALPVENLRLARLVGISVDEFDALWPAIEDKFERTEAGYVNKRLESHRKIALEGKAKRSAGARSTNAKRYAQRSLTDSHSDAHSERSATRIASARAAVAQRSPPTPTPTPQSEDPLPPPSGGDGASTGGPKRPNGTNPRAQGTNPRAQAERDSERTRWKPLLERAKASGFREPYPIDSPESYETSLKLHERDHPPAESAGGTG